VLGIRTKGNIDLYVYKSSPAKVCKLAHAFIFWILYENDNDNQ